MKRRTFLALAAAAPLAGYAPRALAATSVLRQGTFASPVPIVVLGDSISFGAGKYGNSDPKFNTSWPGQLRYQLSQAGFGNAGTGFVNANPDVLANPPYDSRWAFGPGVYPIQQGLHQRGVYGVPAGSWVSFTATASAVDLSVFLLPSSGAAYAQIDNGPWRRVRSAPGGSADLPIQPGLHPNHLVTRVPASSFGQHRITVHAVNGSVKLWGVEAHTGRGSISVSNASVSGRALLSLGVRGDFNDEVGGTTGLPVIDTLQRPRAGVVIIACGVNDWQAARSTAEVEAFLDILVRRVWAGGGTPVLYLPPQPAPSLRPSGGPSYTQVAGAFQRAAQGHGVAFVNHQRLYASTWSDEYAIWQYGQSIGAYADGLHPSDRGSTWMVSGYGAIRGIRSALGL